MIAMNTYVGTLNAIPDSRTPRRFTAISTTIDASPSATACGMSDGYADVIAAIPLDTDTETVRM